MNFSCANNIELSFVYNYIYHKGNIIVKVYKDILTKDYIWELKY